MGVFVLIDVKWSSDPLGLFWAFLNAAFFAGYVVLGHRISQSGASGGVERLGAAMFVAFVFVMPIGFVQAFKAFSAPTLVLAGIGVGICSSVIPYICDQLAMSRLPRASFALLLALLPATATIVGVTVLAQIPSPKDVLGVILVMAGVAVHKTPRIAKVSETQNAENSVLHREIYKEIKEADQYSQQAHGVREDDVFRIGRWGFWNHAEMLQFVQGITK